MPLIQQLPISHVSAGNVTSSSVTHTINSSSLALTIRNEIAAALSELIRQPLHDVAQDAHLRQHQQFRVTTPAIGVDSSDVLLNSFSAHLASHT